MSIRKRKLSKRRTGARRPKSVERDADLCVQYYLANQHLFQTAASSIVSACTNDPILKRHIHFIKHRVKDPDHLRRKIVRKSQEAHGHGKKWLITPANLFTEITDLAGVRILHLHSDQIVIINDRLLAIFDEQQIRLVDGPIANCWDSDAERFYRDLGFTAQQRESMYTSVHYTVEMSPRTKVACEIQVRTMADEIWGEVSHTINYPTPTANESCIEQLRVLARVTSGCTWLVNSIFRSQTPDRKKKRVE